jgi:hypothetical protein
MFAFLASGNAGTALASAIPGILSIAVAIYAVHVATQQSRTAAQRLLLDFFDRRFETWEKINAAVNGRMAYLSAAPPARARPPSAARVLADRLSEIVR